ncbi:MAG TPA: error-prone DNA polymerase [Hyphomicrobiaceae bacterium]|nr:error-prone DNA polymerase [Hyphomicrobiaceae bacterium]
MTAFAELIAVTNFSFLRGASHAHEMVAQAAELGLAAIGIADRNTLAGVVRAFEAAKERNIRLLVGVRLVTSHVITNDAADAPPTEATEESFEAVCYPADRAAYGRLCRLLTNGNRRADKGQCHFSFEELLVASQGQILIAIPPRNLTPGFIERIATLAAAAPGRVYLAAAFNYRGDERRRLGELSELAARLGTPLVATTDALYHHPLRRPLADVLACIREKCTLAEAGYRLEANAERHLKSGAEMARLFAADPRPVARTLEIAKRIHFSLDDLRYEYPGEPVPAGKSPQAHLEDLTWKHAARRFPDGIPGTVRALLTKELALIARLDYARYFLTVYDIVRFAREEASPPILCQGRGSAANSTVCYCLGITSVDPTRIDLLFERFISADRDEPPDIDVDFEHERREEVIQYLYARYGRDRAAICATVIHYRSRMAIREVGKALGLKEDVTAALAGLVWGVDGEAFPEGHVREAGLDPANPSIRQAVALARQLIGFPRHLSQHVGGFVLTRERLDETAPIHNGAMPDRTFLEWDKDDIDALGMLKVDVLALGMLTAIRKSFDLIERHYGKTLTLATVPAEDTAVYAMLSKADTVGVFQVESRAQMSMLPRLKPACFYDLVIEVAIVRPGPIQGDMVHPYLRRREGLEPVSFPSAPLEKVLSKTLGVPLFQEQAMQIAIVAAGFSPEEADKLRRAMATFRHTGTIHTFRSKFIDGMVGNGYSQEFADRCFGQIEGFGEYGFPESHAASFALLVYVSAWLKHHYPEAFCAALLNSQPMGFYAPAQLVRDAREHGVTVLHPDVNASDWACTLEMCTLETRESPSPRPPPTLPRAPTGRKEGWGEGQPHTPTSAPSAAPHTSDAPGPLPASGERGSAQRLRPRCAVRLGLNLVNGIAKEPTQQIVAARGAGYASVGAVWLRSGAPVSILERLADADAFRSTGLDRRAALWAVRGLDGGVLHLSSKRASAAASPILNWNRTADLFDESHVELPAASLGEHVVADYASLGLSLKAHPVAFFRDELSRRRILTSAQHWDKRLAGRRVTVAGLVLVRQRPGTAKGVIFLTLEDETGIVNVVVWPKVFEPNRRIVMGAQFLAVRGLIQRQGRVIHVVAETLIDLTGELKRLGDGTATLPSRAREHSENFWRAPWTPPPWTPPWTPKSRDFH